MTANHPRGCASNLISLKDAIATSIAHKLGAFLCELRVCLCPTIQAPQFEPARDNSHGFLRFAGIIFMSQPCIGD
jgi:hypothetical protein